MQHASIHHKHGRNRAGPLQILRRLACTDQMRSLLTVYAQHRERKLGHAVAVSLAAMGLHHRIAPGNSEGVRTAILGETRWRLRDLKIRVGRLPAGDTSLFDSLLTALQSA